MGPLTRRYDVMDGNDEEMLAVAADSIQNMIAANRRININDAMLLYGACAYSAAVAAEGRQDSCMAAIEEGLPDMLSDHQVMIGVPDMIRRLEVSIADRAGGDEVNVVMQDPIRPSSYVKRGSGRVQPASISASFSNSSGGDGNGDGVDGKAAMGGIP